MLVNISGGGIQRPLHHTGLWEPTGGVGEKAWLCALPSTRGRQKGRVILGPFWMVGHSLVDQVTGDVDDVSTFMVDLQGGGHNCIRTKLSASGIVTGAPAPLTMAVSSRAMRMVPVTRRKMMKMLMILSRDRSSQTTIYGKEGGGNDIGVNEVRPVQRSDTWRNLGPGRLGPDACVRASSRVNKNCAREKGKGSQLRFLNAPKLLRPPFVRVNMAQAAR